MHKDPEIRVLKDHRVTAKFQTNKPYLIRTCRMYARIRIVADVVVYTSGNADFSDDVDADFMFLLKKTRKMCILTESIYHEKNFLFA